MDISIIVPVYNVEKYLNKCVESIIENTYKKIEIILVDDGSTDKSGEMCDELSERDSRIKVIHKLNGGLSSARNAGLEIATGEYISFVDSDDYIAPIMYERMMDAAIKNNADIIQCGVYKVSETGVVSTAFEVQDWCCKGTDILDYFYAMHKIPVMVCNKLFRKSIIGSHRMMLGRNNEDNIFIIDVLQELRCVVSVHEQYYYYLTRSNSIMGSTFTEKKFDSIYAYNYMCDRTKFIAPHYLAYVQYWKCMNSFYLWYDVWRSNIDEETRRKYNDVIRKEFDSTYPYVIELGDKVCRKDKIRLRLFKINKNLAARIYNMYLKGLDR